VFSLSLRDVELILAERGIFVAHESIWRSVAPKESGFSSVMALCQRTRST
jgi:transposase-like protein